jgi:hypothetical protein
MTDDSLTEIELERLIRGDSGAPCPMQARVLHYLVAFLAEKGADAREVPNLAEMARRFDTPRQVVSAALRALQKKGFASVQLEVEPVVINRRRIRRTIRVTLPAHVQLALPLGARGGPKPPLEVLGAEPPWSACGPPRTPL